MIDLQNISVEIKKYFSKYVDLGSDKLLIMSTTSLFNVDVFITQGTNHFINLHKSNDIQWLNKFFEHVNERLPIGGYFIGCAETFQQRKTRVLSNFPPIKSHIYYLFDFIFKRIFPKLKFTQKFYFSVTHGKGRVLSKAEILGRLVCCGFEIVDFKEITGLVYFITKKIKAPVYDMNPSYGLVYKMPRVGKNGKKIGVYKFRTMHPYSEYLQDYVINNSGYKENGKPENDFRLTPWGKVMRKYWLDELPQLINVLKCEMRLVGIRPVSQRFLDELPADLISLRLKHKPGCIPPYVSLLKQGVNGFMEAEEIYLREKESHPIWTDIKYIGKAIFNIGTGKISSS